MEKGKELPVINIEGTDFLVDVKTFELREKTNPENIIPFEEMQDVGDGYRFEYSPKRKNLPKFSDQDYKDVMIPEFVVLDPEGMAKKYGLPPGNIKGKTDFDLMVDQKALDMRINKGMLPTVDIAGHTFFVDIRMDMLRPKDDFGSKGIVFSEIDHYYDDLNEKYQIPYDPEYHEFREIDYENITELPKNLITVEFPHETVLDPIGWNRYRGFDPMDDLKAASLKPHFNARTIPWGETYLPEIIKENLDRFFRGRVMPTVTIEGTEFMVDVREMKLREKADPANTIAYDNLKSAEHGYKFDYHLKDKNVAFPFDPPEDVKEVTIPEFVELDPEGMAYRYGLDPNGIKGKTDFDLMVDNDIFESRIKGGLPTLDIAGNRYQVDLENDRLNPLNNMYERELNPIPISALHEPRVLDPILGNYLQFYNPQSGQFEHLDKEKLTEIPKDVIAVTFPHPHEIDPVGWNRSEGLDPAFRLKNINLKMHHVVERIPWEKTNIPILIRANIEKVKKQEQKREAPIKKRKKGRGI